MKKSFLILVSCLFILLLSGCQIPTLAEKTTETQPVQSIEDETLVISAVGDIMMHNTQIKAGFLPQTGSYDYSSFFTHIKPLLQASDLTIGNLETTFAGAKAGYSGFPRFNAPEILAANLKEAGFQILTTANNHCMDKGQTGLASTLDCLDKAGLLHTGTARSPEEYDDILIVEKKEIKLAFLAYTFSTNGLKPALDKMFSVNYLDTERIIANIKKAKYKGAQLIIVSLHNGEEYQPYPNTAQEQIAKSLLEAGADVILGHHPHVLQPTCIIQEQQPEQNEENNKNETNNRDKKKFIIYSLGNFISDQQGTERKSGIILNLFFGIDTRTKEPYLQGATYIPIRTRRYWQNGKYNFEVVPIEPALTSINMGQKYNYTRQDITDLEESWQHVNNTLTSTDSLVKVQPLAIPLDGLNLIETWRNFSP